MKWTVRVLLAILLILPVVLLKTQASEIHEHAYEEKITWPTCTEQGYTTFTCPCGDSYVGRYTHPTGHRFSDWYTYEPATCVHKGEERKDCGLCDHYESRELPTIPHNYTATVTKPTCTGGGYTTHTCSCGDFYVDSETEPAHSYGEWEVWKEAACEEEGEERRTCQNCNAWESRRVEAPGHRYTETVTAPTCTEQGYTTHTCVCGDSYTSDAVPATDHSFGDWIQSKAPTAYGDGEARRDCENCDHFETVAVAALKVTAPKIKASSNTTTGKPRITWAVVSGADLYRVYRATSKTGSYTRIRSTAALSINDTGAKAGTNYYYKVKAVNTETGEVSEFSNTVNRVCDLKKPTLVLAVQTATGKPKLTWSAIGGAEKYYIARATSKTGTYTRLATVTGTTWIDTTAKPGTNYYYKVKALHAKDSADSAYSDALNRVCDLAKPVVSVTRSGGDSKISWNTVKGAEKYHIFRATSADGTYYHVKTAVTARTFTDSGVTAGRTYYYKVKAIHSNTAANSAFSAVKSIKAK